jgi:8-oxo-dGTP pyrophosphatase MutT (NUDIX family)
MKERIWHLLVPVAAPIIRRLPWPYRRELLRVTNPTYLVGVGAVCLDPTGRVLVLKHRLLNPAYQWGLPSGNLERGETPEQGIRREVYEETGISLEELVPLHIDGDARLVELFFLARVESCTPRLQADEILDYAWSDPATVELPMRPSHHAALLRAVTYQCLLGDPVDGTRGKARLP